VDGQQQGHRGAEVDREHRPRQRSQVDGGGQPEQQRRGEDQERQVGDQPQRGAPAEGRRAPGQQPMATTANSVACR
jgi:hypothetical protein